MLSNILKDKIAENEKAYIDGKAALEEIISRCNLEYNKLLNEYKGKTQNIKNNSMLSDSGKREQGTKLHDEYIQKVKIAATNYIKELQAKNQQIIEAIYKEQENNNEVLKGQKIPQIVYVSCMMNSINSLQDAVMLKEVFDYACLEDNFSSEVMNLIYLKANSLLNALNQYPTKVVDETQSAEQERIINQATAVNKAVSDGKLRSILQAILTEINKFKHDYISEFKQFESKFNYWLNSDQYPRNLFVAADYKRDFVLEGALNKNDPWNISKKNNDLWNRS